METIQKSKNQKMKIDFIYFFCKKKINTMMIEKFLKITSIRSSTIQPLGRWCLCGDKNKLGIDPLEWKELQKQKRKEMVEKKLDPFDSCPKTDLFYEKQKKQEEYMIPFVFNL